MDQDSVILDSHSELSGPHSRKTGLEVQALSLTSARAKYKSSQGGTDVPVITQGGRALFREVNKSHE